MLAAADAKSASGECRGWDIPSASLRVTVARSAAALILVEAIRGLALVPRRGAEIGGILLGSVETAGGHRVVRIGEAVPVACEYAFGPSYVLSENDTAAFRAAIIQHRAGRELRPVGFYRSHTRAEPELSEEDLRLMAAFFPEPASVALLVRPNAMRPSSAALFYRQGGRFCTAPDQLEIDSGSAPGADPGLETSRRPDIPLPSFLQPPQPGRLGKIAARWYSWWVQVPLLACVLVADALLGYHVARGFAAVPPRAIAPQQAYALSLKVTESGDNLHLSWDRNAPAVKAASAGRLSIQDGDQAKSLSLSRDQLQGGSVMYRRLTGAVEFRLEVSVAPNTTLAETWSRSQDAAAPETQPGEAVWEPQPENVR
jgi:hypothetical protein